MKSKLLLLTLLCAAACVYAAEGQVYKWTDAAGIVHYSDAPPPKDTLNVQTVHVTGGDRPHAVPMAENPESSDKQADASAQGAPQAGGTDASDRTKACQAARSNLEVLQSKFPVAVTGSDGKQQALDDKSRQAQIAAANAQIVLYCQ